MTKICSICGKIHPEGHLHHEKGRLPQNSSQNSSSSSSGSESQQDDIDPSLPGEEADASSPKASGRNGGLSQAHSDGQNDARQKASAEEAMRPEAPEPQNLEPQSSKPEAFILAFPGHPSDGPDAGKGAAPPRKETFLSSLAASIKRALKEAAEEMINFSAVKADQDGPLPSEDGAREPKKEKKIFEFEPQRFLAPGSESPDENSDGGEDNGVPESGFILFVSTSQDLSGEMIIVPGPRRESPDEDGGAAAAESGFYERDDGVEPDFAPLSTGVRLCRPVTFEAESLASQIKESAMSPNEPAVDGQEPETSARPESAPIQIAMAKPAGACCPDCHDRDAHDDHESDDHESDDHESEAGEHDAHAHDAHAHDAHAHDAHAREKKSGACCPSCDDPAPLVSLKLARIEENGRDESACCPSCESRGALTEALGEHESEEGPSLKRLFAASILAIGSEVGHFLSLPEWSTITLAALAIILGGISTWLAGWKSICRKSLDIMALMSVAVTGAMLIGEFSEGALVLVLFTLAEKLEDRSVDKARRAIASLLGMAPEKAFVDDGQGGLKEAKASDVPAGARVRVRPGEKLALDGVVVEGTSAIDQSPITGESVPVQKFPGDQVFAGTLNVSGVIDYEVTVPYGDSALARIVRTVEEAERAKAPVERFVERFARIYTPAVFLLALAAAILPPLLLGGEWRSWIYRALALLVISCPCALVVSTPVAVLSALASATKKGLLVKGGAHLEEGRLLKVMAMDKTGTLTSGKPSRTDFAAIGGYDAKEAEKLSASLASLSNHPVSQAIAKASGLKGDELAILAQFKDRPGQGVTAEFGGRALALGNARLASDLGAMTGDLEKEVRRLESEGKTVTILVDGKAAAALIATADTIKEESVKAVSELRELGVKTVMLTGDNEEAAAAVASKVGADSYRARLMPEEKLAVIEELGKSGKVGMVGDGINDAPALAKADIGFSMGAAGTDTAIETADVAIMDDNLAKIPLFIRLSRAVHRILTHNIAFILLVKLTFITVTLMGRTDMWMAVLADIGVTLIVVANSLRLSRH